jgi:hypothetical protein
MQVENLWSEPLLVSASKGHLAMTGSSPPSIDLVLGMTWPWPVAPAVAQEAAL